MADSRFVVPLQPQQSSQPRHGHSQHPSSTSFSSSSATTSSNYSVAASSVPRNPHMPSQQQNQPPIPPTKPKSEASRLSVFLAECLSVGCLKGFRHFELYLRGREELLLRIYSNPKLQQQQVALHSANASNLGSKSSSRNSLVVLSRQPSSKDLARAHSGTSVSGKIRQRLAWQSTENLPPASPCDRELEKESSNTAFLIAGYARYKCPFVWLRTNHSHFTKSGDTSKQDDPVKLASLSKWKSAVAEQVSVIDIIAELVSTVISPPPKNPLEICHPFYDGLPLQESVVCCGAMLNLLRRIYLSDSSFACEVLGDIEAMSKRYFAESIELQSAVEGRVLSCRAH